MGYFYNLQHTASRMSLKDGVEEREQDKKKKVVCKNELNNMQFYIKMIKVHNPIAHLKQSYR